MLGESKAGMGDYVRLKMRVEGGVIQDIQILEQNETKLIRVVAFGELIRQVTDTQGSGINGVSQQGLYRGAGRLLAKAGVA